MINSCSLHFTPAFIWIASCVELKGRLAEPPACCRQIKKKIWLDTDNMKVDTQNEE